MIYERVTKFQSRHCYVGPPKIQSFSNTIKVFRKTDNENLSLFLEKMFLKIVKSKSGVANPIDISYLNKNRENLLQNFKLLPVFHEMLDFENDKSVELVAKCLANREELWHKFFTTDKMAKRHYIKLFLKCCQSRINGNEKRYQFESKYPEKLVDSLLYHSLPGLNDSQGTGGTQNGHVTKTILKGKFEEVSDMFQVFQNVLILIGQQKKRISEDIFEQSSKLLDIELSNRLPSGSNVLSILNRASQSAVSTKKDGEKAQAIITIRSALLYLKEFCNLSSVSGVPFEKMLTKVHHDLESVSILIGIIKNRTDDILFFKGKPSPFETLVELYNRNTSVCSSSANQIADLISAILHAPAAPFLAGQISPEKFLSLAKRTSDQWSSSKWLSNLKTLLSDNLEDLISSARSDSYNNDSIPTILSIILCSETPSGGEKAKNSTPEFQDFISIYLASYLGWICDTEDNTNIDSLIKYCSNFSSIDDKMKKKLESDWSIGGKKPPKHFDNVAKVIWWTRKFNVEDEEKCISEISTIINTINLQEINALKSRLEVFVKFIIQTEKSLDQIFESISKVDQNFGEEIRTLIWNEIIDQDRSFYKYHNFWPNVSREEFFKRLEIMKPKTILNLDQILEYIGPIKIESKTSKDAAEDQSADPSDEGNQSADAKLNRTQAELLLKILLQFCTPGNFGNTPAIKTIHEHIHEMLQQNSQLVNCIQFTDFYNLCICSTNPRLIKRIMELASFDSFLLEDVILDENASYETRFNLLGYVTDSSFIENSQLLQILENKPSDLLPEASTSLIYNVIGSKEWANNDFDKIKSPLNIPMMKMNSHLKDSHLENMVEQAIRDSDYATLQLLADVDISTISLEQIETCKVDFNDIACTGFFTKMMESAGFIPQLADHLQSQLLAVEQPIEGDISEMISLVVTNCDISSDICVDIGRLVLKRYQGSLSSRDQNLLQAFQKVESKAIDSSIKQLRPFMFGESQKESDPDAGLNLTQRDSKKFFLSLERTRILHSIKNVPLLRTLDTKFEEYDDVTYDPAFMLPIMCDSLRPSVAVDLIQLINSGALSYLIAMLQLNDENLRSISIECLSRIEDHSESFRWKNGTILKQLMLLIRRYLDKNERPLNGVVANYLIRGSRKSSVVLM